MQRLRFSIYFKPTMILLDIVVFVAVFYFIYLSQYPLRIAEQEHNAIILLVLSVFWILLSGKTRLYQVKRSLTFTNYLERFFTHLFIFLMMAALLSRVVENHFLKANLYRIGGVFFAVIFFIKSLVFFFLKYARSKGINVRNVMFLGHSASMKILEQTIRERKDYGFKIFDFEEPHISPTLLKDFWQSNGIHTLFMPSEPILEEGLQAKIFEEAKIHRVKIVLIPNVADNEYFSYELAYIESLPVLNPIKFPLDFYSNRLIKRIFDIVFSISFIVLIGSWLYPLIALLIKIDGKGPIFFVQKRYGYRNKVFDCIKFRTMRCSNQPNIFDNQDDRITKIGRFLRKTSLDETPQFINILLGDMSVVGPRPHMIMVDNWYKPQIQKYGIRSAVKPGLTGLAQVSGFRGEKANMMYEMEKRILSDYFYVKNWSFSLDLVIILKTIVLIIEGDNNAH